MKNSLLKISLIFLFGSFAFPDDTAKLILGTWKWDKVKMTQTGETMEVGILLGGMATDVRTEFKDNGMYIEHKNKLGSDSLVASKEREWKLESNNTILKLKNKADEWESSAIKKITKDTLILEMTPEMQMIMLKVK